MDNLLYSADAYFSCFADLAVTSPEEYRKAGQVGRVQGAQGVPGLCVCAYGGGEGWGVGCACVFVSGRCQGGRGGEEVWVG